jgi:hypothetical protein
MAPILLLSVLMNGFQKLAISIQLVLGCGLFGVCAKAAERAHPQQQKSDSMTFLQDLRRENSKRLGEIDSSLSKRIDADTDAKWEDEIAALKADKREHMLRQEFLDRLILQVDTKFRGGDLRNFLEVTLTDMAKTDAMSASSENTSLWRFMKNAADAVKRIPDQKENVLSFLEGYMSKSVSNPVRPDDYMNQRNYTNGSKNESGSPMERDEVGAVADQRLQQPLGNKAGAQKVQAKAQALINDR